MRSGLSSWSAMRWSRSSTRWTIRTCARARTMSSTSSIGCRYTCKADPGRSRHRAMPPPGRIICADDLTPADTVLMQHQGVAGFMTEFGGPNSHTAILARSLNIPAVVGLHRSAALLRDGDEVVLDGREGVVIVSPGRRRQVVLRTPPARDRAHRGRKAQAALDADGDRGRGAGGAAGQRRAARPSPPVRCGTARPGSVSIAPSSCS